MFSTDSYAWINTSLEVCSFASTYKMIWTRLEIYRHRSHHRQLIAPEEKKGPRLTSSSLTHAQTASRFERRMLRTIASRREDRMVERRRLEREEKRDRGRVKMGEMSV